MSLDRSRRKTRCLGPAAALLVIFVAGRPSPAMARLRFGFLPSRGPAEAAALERDFLSRLERTRSYGIARVAADSYSAACPLEQGLDKIARLVLEKSAKLEARLEVFDCRTGTLDPPRVMARSAKLSSLAASLRADFIDAYPLLAELAVEQGRLWADAGPEERVRPGLLLYAYAERPGRTYELLRVLRVKSYQEASFRSELEERYRVPGAPGPGAGEVLSPKPLAPIPGHALPRPVLGGIVASRRLLDGPRIAAAARAPASGPWPSPLRLAVPETRAVGGGESLSVVFYPAGPGGALRLRWRWREGGKGKAKFLGYEARLDAREVSLWAYGSSGAPEALARAPWNLPVQGAPRGGGVPVRLVSYGAWHEIYAAGSFLAGIEDHRHEPGDIELVCERAGCFSEPALFEIVPAGAAAPY